MKFFFAILLATAGAIALPTLAQDAASGNKQTTKKAPKKKTAPTAKSKAVDEEDEVPDVKSLSTTEYSCELGNKLTIYRNADDDKYIALRWKKELLRLSRVDTTTGANRFENHKHGWVWIDIPDKGMLLDSKHSHQLANECKTPEQMKAKTPEEAVKN
jgi:membrane-bound inhibitor of C-type lysozyme